MILLSFDIETAPLPNARELIAEYYPFDPDSVKTGNFKDPEKIAAKIEAERIAHVEKKMDRAQLDPMLSYICAIGTFNPDYGYRMYTSSDELEEASAIDAFIDDVRAAGKQDKLYLAGWNCNGFDVPFIQKRGWHSKCELGDLLIDMQGRIDRNVIDLMKVFTCQQYGEYAKLERTANFLNCEYPDRPEGVVGKDFYKDLAENRERALGYFRGDLFETYYIARAMNVLGRAVVA